MSDNRPIGLFDSGVGGLSVLAEIKSLLPAESFIFLADQANIPYGQKTKKQLNELTERITRFLLTHDIKLLVVACNTATCYAIDHLRSTFSIPIVGVVPAIKPAANLTREGKIAIMATPATSKSAYLKKLIKEFAPALDVFRVGCDGLEESVEYLKLKEVYRLLDLYLDKVKKTGSDVIVLGCTHYPFLKEEIKKRISGNIRVIDSGRAIATRVESILKDSASFAKENARGLYYTTGDPRRFSKVASTLLKYKVIASKALI